MYSFGENSHHKKLTQTKFIYINSANANSGTNSNPSIYFPPSLFTNNSNSQKTLKISLYSCTINREWYNVINGINDILQYYNGTISQYITIPEGSYSVYELMTLLNTLLVGMTLSYDLVTNKYTFTPVDLTSWINPTTCGTFLGLQNGITYTGIFTSEFPVNMLYESDIYLNTNIGTTGYSLDNVNGLEIQSSTIIEKVPITVPPFGNIIFNANEKHSSLTIPMLNNLTSLNLWWSTSRLRKLENLIQPWSVTLRIDIYEN